MERGTEVKIVGGAVTAGGPVLAYLQDGTWHLGVQRFERITCKGPVCIDFKVPNGVRSYGPFPEVTIHGELVTSSTGVLARYRRMDDVWYLDHHAEAATFILRDPPSGQ